MAQHLLDRVRGLGRLRRVDRRLQDADAASRRHPAPGRTYASALASPPALPDRTPAGAQSPHGCSICGGQLRPDADRHHNRRDRSRAACRGTRHRRQSDDQRPRCSACGCRPGRSLPRIDVCTLLFSGSTFLRVPGLAADRDDRRRSRDPHRGLVRHRRRQCLVILMLAPAVTVVASEVRSAETPSP
jgi:hypothetical protein